MPLALRLAALASVPILVGCSWSRFDDLEDSVPVVQIEGPGYIPGFGARMASLPVTSGTRLLVGGDTNSPYALAAYHIADDRPTTSPAGPEFCGSSCVSGDSLTPLASARAPGGLSRGCFVFGVGDLAGTRGLLGRCEDGASFVYPVPGDDPPPAGPFSPQDVIDEALLGTVRDGFLHHGASLDDSPLLAATCLTARQAWFYAPGTATPTLLPTPDAAASDPAEDFGADVVVATLKDGDHLVAVSAPRMDDPNQNGHVWLYRVDSASHAISPWGCLAGQRSGFGLYMIAGPVTGDANDELLIADEDSITVYDAGLLGAQPLPEQCGAPLLSTEAYVATISCADGGKVTGCQRTPFAFGRAVALADVDGNGTNEVVVGMADLDVDGTGAAGAVLVYRVERDPTRTGLLETRYLSKTESSDGLGASVVPVRVGARDVIAAGAPGARSVFLFYCSTLGGSGKDSFRCQ